MRRTMAAEYNRPVGHVKKSSRALVRAFGDMRTRASHAAFLEIFRDLPPHALCVSVGGGPTRVHERLVNVNLAPFPNVDLVADAYRLPYADGVVDAIHCEAVLEHLEYPDAAVHEMARVLRPGRLAFAATPFLQPFHAYPDHFQNFTLHGHRRLFERAGLTVLSAGTCVGGSFAIRDLALNYIRNVLPGGPAGRALALGLSILTLPLLWLDLAGNRRNCQSSMVASTTFVLAKKPL